MAIGQSIGLGQGAGLPGGKAPNLQTKFVTAAKPFADSGADLIIQALPVDFSDARASRQVGFADATLNLLLLSAALVPLVASNLASIQTQWQKPAVVSHVAPNLLTSTLYVQPTQPRLPLVANAQVPKSITLDVPPNVTARLPVALDPFYQDDFQSVGSAPSVKVDAPPNLLHSTLAPAATTKVRTALVQNQQLRISTSFDAAQNATLLMQPVVVPVFGMQDSAPTITRRDIGPVDLLLNFSALNATVAATPFASIETSWYQARQSVNPTLTARAHGTPTAPVAGTPFTPIATSWQQAARSIGQTDIPINYAMLNTTPATPPRSVETSWYQARKDVFAEVMPNATFMQPVVISAFGVQDFMLAPVKREIGQPPPPPNLLHDTLRPATVYPFQQNDWPSPILNVSRYQQDYYYNGVLMETALPPIVPAAETTTSGVKRRKSFRLADMESREELANFIKSHVAIKPSPQEPEIPSVYKAGVATEGQIENDRMAQLALRNMQIEAENEIRIEYNNQMILLLLAAAADE